MPNAATIHAGRIFSPFEAHSIKKLLGLSENPGLEGLKRALGFRVYESINVQSISDETENSFVFRMNECRVQVARKRKGLDDYPCKSAWTGRVQLFCQGDRQKNKDAMCRLSSGPASGRVVLCLEIQY